MTDEQYVFHQDVKERKKMKTGAMHKKNGCKSKKCTLPSDYLSKKEKAKLSGPVISIKMNQPYYDYRSFKKLPLGLQREYFESLITNYGARYIDIAGMLGISKITMYNLCKSFNPPLPRTRSGKPARTVDNRWVNFVAKEVTPKEVETIVERSIEMEEKKDLETSMGVTTMNLAMNGTKQVIVELLEAVLTSNCEYSFKIDICKLEGQNN